MPSRRRATPSDPPPASSSRVRGPWPRVSRRGCRGTLRLGFLDRERLAELYASADICVLPSHTETCGLVALEAMASGLPVVAADAGGLRESVTHQLNGLRVTWHDATGFAAAICALALNRDLRLRMGAQSRLLAVARDSAAEDDELMDQYEQILGQRPGQDAWRAAS